MLSVLAILFGLTQSISLPGALDGDIIDTSIENFKLWIDTFGISLEFNEMGKRYNIWKETVSQNNKFNIEKHSWKRGVNQFTHLTFDEFNKFHLMAPQECSATQHNMKTKPYIINPNANPNEIDWRDKNVISEVKDQGGCGSCYS